MRAFVSDKAKAHQAKVNELKGKTNHIKRTVLDVMLVRNHWNARPECIIFRIRHLQNEGWRIDEASTWKQWPLRSKEENASIGGKKLK